MWLLLEFPYIEFPEYTDIIHSFDSCKCAGLIKMSFMITIQTLQEPEVYQFVLKVMLFEMRA